MPAKRMITGIAGSVFILGIVGLGPLLIWSAVLATWAICRDLCAMIADSTKHLHLSDRSHGNRYHPNGG
jgi:hypothetical protein